MAKANKQNKAKAYALFDIGYSFYAVHKAMADQAAYATLHRWWVQWKRDRNSSKEEAA